MNCVVNAIAELKSQCEILGEKLYAIEIGENTFDELCKAAQISKEESESKEGLMKFLGVLIYIHRKPLQEYSVNELLTEVAERDKNRREMLIQMSKINKS